MDKKNNFDKEKSLIVKGFAILCMITYHVWGIGKYTPLFGENINLEEFISQFGHICVPIYLFLSGYAIYKVTSRNDFRYIELINRIIKLLFKYWLIFLIFIPFGFVIFNTYDFNIRELLFNFSTIKITYNGDWWFLRLYIQLMLIFPVFRIVVSKNSTVKTFMICGFIYFLGFLMFLLLKLNVSPITGTMLYQDIQVIFVDQLIFTIGCIFAKNNTFNKIEKLFKDLNLNKLSIYLIIISFIFIIRSTMYIFFEYIVKFGSPDWFDFIYVPVIIFCVYNIFSKGKRKKIMIRLGENSDNMWLTHTFFYKLYLQQTIYALNSSVLILFVVIGLSFVSSLVLNYMYKNILNTIIEIKYKNFEINRIYKI